MASTFRHPCKCMNCSLHFAVYSWKEDWADGEKIHCPECGGTSIMQFTAQPLEQEIYVYVPGVATGIKSIPEVT